MTNLAELLLDHPFADDRELIHGSCVDWTKAEAVWRVRALADELLAAGVAPGHGVAVVRSHAPDVIIAMTAIWSVGGVFVPVNPLLPAAGVEEIIAIVRPAAVLDDDGIHQHPDAVVHCTKATPSVWTTASGC